MHVTVDQSGHQHAAMQVDDRRMSADQRLEARVAADVDDAAGTDRERLLQAVARIDRVDLAVSIHGIGRRGRSGRMGRRGGAKRMNQDRRQRESRDNFFQHACED